MGPIMKPQFQEPTTEDKSNEDFGDFEETAPHEDEAEDAEEDFGDFDEAAPQEEEDADFGDFEE